jgi:hypothetical protein
VWEAAAVRHDQHTHAGAVELKPEELVCPINELGLGDGVVALALKSICGVSTPQVSLYVVGRVFSVRWVACAEAVVAHDVATVDRVCLLAPRVEVLAHLRVGDDVVFHEVVGETGAVLTAYIDSLAVAVDNAGS